MTRGELHQALKASSPTGTCTVAAEGSSSPGSTKDEGASARDAGPLTSNNLNFDFACPPAQVKRVATAAARLALAGYSLYPLADQRYLVAKWNLSKEFQDLKAVEQFLAEVAP